MTTHDVGVGRAAARPTAPPRDPGRAAAHPAITAPGERRAHHPGQEGVLSLEAVWVLPALVFLVIGLLSVVGLVRDVLLLHEAARAGVRMAATTTGEAPVVTAARMAAPELQVVVRVDPVHRSDGDLVTVRVSAIRTIGPVHHQLSARAVGRVEPVVRPVGPGRGPGFLQGPVAP